MGKYKRRKAPEHGTNRPGGRRLSQKVERQRALSRWVENLRSLAGQTVGVAQLDVLMPDLFIEDKIDYARGEMIALAVRNGLLVATPGKKQWKVLPPSGQPAAKDEIAGNSKPSDDPGTIEHVPLEQLTKVLTQVMATWGTKGEVVTTATVQGRAELLRQYTRAALSHLLSTVTTNGRRLFEKKGGGRGYCLTSEGVAALAAFRSQLVFEARSGNVIVVVTSQGGIAEVSKKKSGKTVVTKPLTPKGGKKLPDSVFDFTKLPGQTPVEGVAPKGFSKNLELQCQALLLLWVLTQAVDKVTRGLFRAALRWKYGWGEHVPENSVGRVMFGLMPDYIDIQSVDVGGLNSPDDVVVLLKAGRKFAGVETETPRQPAPPEPPPKTEADLLREERDTAVARANAAEVALRAHEDKVQAFIEAALNLMGPKGLATLRRVLSS